MRVSRSYVLWVLALVVFVAAFLGLGFLVRTSVEATFNSDQRVRDARTTLFAMLRAQLDEETGIRGYLVTRDRALLQPYTSASASLPLIFPELQGRLRDLNLDDGVLAATDAQRTNAQWIHNIAEPALRERPRDMVAFQRDGKTLVDRFRSDATRIDGTLTARNLGLQQEFQSSVRSLDVLIVGAGLMLFAIGLLFLMFQTQAQKRIARERELNDESRERETGLRAAFAAERQVTDTLQRAFSQRLLPAMPSMSFSATYVPAAEEAKVGGDWYDAFEIGQHRILFVIGDIAGHGLEAAVAMSRIRNEMLSAAVLDATPSSILQRVNHQMFSQESPVSLVTAIVGIADSRNYTFAYATAGHPPPILAEPDRAPRPLDFGGVPLGAARSSTYRTKSVQSVPGAMLVLYTDGVVEHSRDILAGERELMDSISALQPGDDPASAVYNAIFGDKVASDDVAILTLGFNATRGNTGTTISAEDGKSAFVARMAGTRPPNPAANMRRAS